jgi:hypothetical protein
LYNTPIMICIRFFDTRKDAELAKQFLVENGIYSEVSEDKFENISIQEFGVDARFRLKITEKDLVRTARLLAKKLKNED